MSELWRRLGFVALALTIYRFGTHIPVPGIRPESVAQFFAPTEDNVILQYFNLFSGGALERMSIFALSVVPYISAAIVMQLFSNSLPYLQELKKEGQSGRNKITQYTRYGTVIFALIQSTALTFTFQTAGLIDSESLFTTVVAILSIVTGTVFLMWLGEQISERGIGNGISLIIATSIIVGVPRAFGEALTSTQNDGNYLLLIVLAILTLLVIAFVVFVENAQRRITVNYAQRHQVRGMVQAPASFLPLKLNMSGVIPAIFASTFLLFPASLSQWFGQGLGADGLTNFASIYLAPGSPLYMFLFAILIISFCYIWLALTFSSEDMSDNLKRSGAYIPGIRPGEQTSTFIDTILSRLTVFGALYLTLVCLLPLMLINSFGISFYLGGTSVLIVVVVMLDLQRQIQSYVMSQQYASILKNANISGSKKSRRR